MSTINPSIHPQPTRTHPLVVAMAIFMSGLLRRKGLTWNVGGS